MCQLGDLRGQLIQDSVIAWRLWRLRGENLMSLRAWGGAWTTKLKRADRCPTLTNTHGIYSFRLYSSAVRQRGRAAFVLGQVRLSGRVVKHEAGYRALHCEILALVDQPFLASRYGVKNLDSRDLRTPGRGR